jgi:hypothetical protein
MATELACPIEVLSVSQILDALGIGAGISGEKTEEYLVIPGHDGPRWLIPARSRAAAAVLSIWHPYNFTSRMKWLAICMAARAGVLRLVRSVSSVATSRSGAMQWFDRCGIPSQSNEMVILVGVPSVDRKLVAFLLDNAHRIATVLKVGLTVGGGLSVLHEAEVLRKLEQYNWAPKLLSVHPDLRAAAQKYVHGTMPGREFRPEYMDMLCHLPRSGSYKSLTDIASEMANRLSPLKAQLDKISPGVLDCSLGCLDLDIAVPTMLVHGDFAPWNMRRNPEAGYVLVDWEWGNFSGLPAYDLLHFHFNDDRLFGEKAGGYTAFRSKSICSEYFRRMDIDAELLPRLAIAYLLDQLDSHCHGRGSEIMPYTLRQLAIVANALGSVTGSGAQMPQK